MLSLYDLHCSKKWLAPTWTGPFWKQRDTEAQQLKTINEWKENRMFFPKHWLPRGQFYETGIKADFLLKPYVHRMHGPLNLGLFSCFLSLSSICSFSKVPHVYFPRSLPFGLVRISSSIFFSWTWPVHLSWEFLPGFGLLLFLSTFGLDKPPDECNCLSWTQCPNMKSNSHFMTGVHFS